MKLMHFEQIEHEWMTVTFMIESKNLQDLCVSLYLCLPNP